MSETVGIDELRVGMFIHLDLGWMQHPFPRSSFRIASPEQISTLRELGLERVRWAPDKSELPAEAAGRLEGDGTAPAASAVETEAPPPDTAAAAAEPTVVTVTAAGPAAPARDPAPPTQRAYAPHCERQFAETGRALREVLHKLATQPEAARAAAEALAHGLVDRVVGSGEMSIRLLAQPFGDALAAHGVNVAVISLLLGHVLGLEEGDLVDLTVGALLHDAGKLELPATLHHPDGSLTQAELAAYRDHVAQGVALGRRMGLAPGALLVVAQHHEHADGSGFPMKLTADRMPVAARIVALVDRFDMLCNPGPLAHALTPHEALSLMFAQCRTQYDTAMLNAFIRMVGVYPAGSVVQLTDDRWAMVVGVNSFRPLKPRVLVADAAVPREQATLLNLEAVPDLGIRRSVHPRQLPDAAFEYLQPRQRVGVFFEPPADELRAVRA